MRLEQAFVKRLILGSLDGAAFVGRHKFLWAIDDYSAMWEQTTRNVDVRYLKELTQGQLNWLAGRWHQPKLTPEDHGTNPRPRDKLVQDDTHAPEKILAGIGFSTHPENTVRDRKE